MILTAYHTRPKTGEIDQKKLFLEDTTEYYLYHGDKCLGEIRVGNGVHVIIYERSLLRIVSEGGSHV